MSKSSSNRRLPDAKQQLIENNELLAQVVDLRSKVAAIEILLKDHHSITQFEYEAKVEELNAELKRMVGDGPEGT